MEQQQGNIQPGEDGNTPKLEEWKLEIMQKDPSHDFYKYPEFGLAPAWHYDVEEEMREDAKRFDELAALGSWDKAPDEPQDPNSIQPPSSGGPSPT